METFIQNMVVCDISVCTNTNYLLCFSLTESAWQTSLLMALSAVPSIKIETIFQCNLPGFTSTELCNPIHVFPDWSTYFAHLLIKWLQHSLSRNYPCHMVNCLVMGELCWIRGNKWKIGNIWYTKINESLKTLFSFAYGIVCLYPDWGTCSEENPFKLPNFFVMLKFGHVKNYDLRCIYI